MLRAEWVGNERQRAGRLLGDDEKGEFRTRVSSPFTDFHVLSLSPAAFRAMGLVKALLYWLSRTTTPL
jgi:hypothetical protein